MKLSEDYPPGHRLNPTYSEKTIKVEVDLGVLFAAILIAAIFAVAFGDATATRCFMFGACS